VLLVTILAAVFIGTLLWRIMRRIVLLVALGAVCVVLTTHLPLHSQSLSSFQLLLSLIGHVGAQSIRHGIGQYGQWMHLLASRVGL
jgi:hypothetical protein